MPVNRVLTDVDRVALELVEQKMCTYWPELYSRKIHRSHIQYVFCYDAVLALSSTIYHTPRVLAIGAHECIASECLKLDGYSVVGIDPEFNCDLHTFKNRVNQTFDIVLAASVLEHVTNVEEFVADSCQLLAYGGYGVFTVDFQDTYRQGDRLPYTDVQFFTAYDLSVRLRDVLKANGCDLVDEPDYTGNDHFMYDGCDYSFASFVFRKGKKYQDE